MQPSTIKLHIMGEAKALKLPVEGREIAPLYTDAAETVFEVRAIPGQYVLYQILR